MKILEESFEQSRFLYKQVCREGNLAVYKRWYKDSPDWPHFETIFIKSHNGYEIGGKVILPAESYPPSDSWGTHGFTYPTKEQALARMDKMKEENIGAKRVKK